MGTYLPGTGTLGCGARCGAGTFHSRDIPPGFLSTTCGFGTSLFHISALPTNLEQYIFSNSIVVGLPFNLIYDISEWWLFYSLVVIWCGYAMRQAMFTMFTSILTGSLDFFLFEIFLASWGRPMTFPFRTVFALSHRFWVVVYSFSLVSR